MLTVTRNFYAAKQNVRALISSVNRGIFICPLPHIVTMTKAQHQTSTGSYTAGRGQWVTRKSMTLS